MPLIKSSAQFLQNFEPPDYLIDGIFQRRFCYSVTGKPGTGKTAVALLKAAHVGIGRPLGGRDVDKGTVLYFAGENPTDVQMRWMGLGQQMGFDPNTIDVHFVEGVIPLSQKVDEIRRELEASRVNLALVIVDTVAAYFEGDDDNNNVQMGDYARLLRSLTRLPGGPCVLLLAHPTKRAADDDLVPKGGGAFLNEIDGNVGLRRDGESIAAETQGKFRGPEFTPIYFELQRVLHPRLKDTKGRLIPTVVAKALDERAVSAREAAGDRDEERLLRLVDQHPRKSQREIASMAGWPLSRVHRLGKKLEAQKMTKPERNGWVLTSAGEKALNATESSVSPLKQLPMPPLPFPRSS